MWPASVFKIHVCKIKITDTKFSGCCVVAITCPGLENGVFTEPVPSSLESQMTYLQTYTYSCMEGYITTDDTVVVCQPDSTLSISPPFCTGWFNNRRLFDAGEQTILS